MADVVDRLIVSGAMAHTHEQCVGRPAEVLDGGEGEQFMVWVEAKAGTSDLTVRFNTAHVQMLDWEMRVLHGVERIFVNLFFIDGKTRGFRLGAYHGDEDAEQQLAELFGSCRVLS
ncbi:hypothetical protein [Plantibacter sp. CFBP 13570]|uniref:hypothetical protein n=1 Tax=Plantibacter sp. CFBP 13570 TaxID=2775272 RepID=UPI001930925F|nr:hypothetical protein [Plantibacter sp. CFBP 13570]MBD8535672.1 hypothetical protein [Plantibacter sp. CFBP 13570]